LENRLGGHLKRKGVPRRESLPDLTDDRGEERGSSPPAYARESPKGNGRYVQWQERDHGCIRTEGRIMYGKRKAKLGTASKGRNSHSFDSEGA